MIKRIFLIVLALAIAYFFGTGFQKNTQMNVSDFSLAEDGKAVVIEVRSSSSMGFVRTAKINRGSDDRSVYVSFYSAFGGFNSSIGAKDSFKIPIKEQDTRVFFTRTNNQHDLVLEKNEMTGKWETASRQAN